LAAAQFQRDTSARQALGDHVRDPGTMKSPVLDEHRPGFPARKLAARDEEIGNVGFKRPRVVPGYVRFRIDVDADAISTTIGAEGVPVSTLVNAPAYTPSRSQTVSAGSAGLCADNAVARLSGRSMLPSLPAWTLRRHISGAALPKQDDLGQVVAHSEECGEKQERAPNPTRGETSCVSGRKHRHVPESSRVFMAHPTFAENWDSALSRRLPKNGWLVLLLSNDGSGPGGSPSGLRWARRPWQTGEAAPEKPL
jgi:hypothetical protein